MGKKVHQIVVIGNIASGKSSLIDALAPKINAHRIEADEFFKSNPFFPLALKDRARWSFASDIWFLHERAKLMQAETQTKQADHTIIDSGLPMSWVYAHSRLDSNHFTQDEWETYKQLYERITADIPQPTLVIALRASIPVLLDRIRHRGREFELAHHTKEYLHQIDMSLQKQIELLKQKKVEVIEFPIPISSFRFTDDTLQHILQTVEKE